MPRRLLLVLALLLAVGAASLLLQDRGLSVACAMAQVDTLRDAGPRGLPVFLGAYALATWAMLPASWPQGAAGFLYGAGPGIALAWAASTGFGFLSFALTRGRFRDRVAGWIARKGGARFAAIDALIAQRGLLAVVLLRLSPIAPYNVINYLLGLTSVSPRTYLLGTAVGSLVPATVYGLLGSAVSDLSQMSEAGRSDPSATLAIVVATLLSSVGLALFVRRALSQYPVAPQPGASSP